MIQAYCPHHGLYLLSHDEARKLASSLLTPRVCGKTLWVNNASRICNEEIDIYINGAKATNKQVMDFVGRKIIK
jgi:hypothetical protein